MKPSEAYESLKLKFTSSNKIPITRATIIREEWDAIQTTILQNLKEKK